MFLRTYIHTNLPTVRLSSSRLGIGFASYSCKFSEYEYSSFGKNTKRIRNKVCLYVVLVRRATRSLYVHVRKLTSAYKRFVSCSDKKTNTNIRIFGKKHEYPNTKRIQILSLFALDPWSVSLLPPFVLFCFCTLATYHVLCPVSGLALPAAGALSVATFALLYFCTGKVRCPVSCVRVVMLERL